MNEQIRLKSYLKTEQQIFDAVCKHLAKQKTRSINISGCVYYDKDSGNRCAIGGIMPIESAKLTEQKYSGENIYGVSHSVPLENVDLLEDLQVAHNSNKTLLELKNELLGIARRYNLDSSAVELIKEWS